MQVELPFHLIHNGSDESSIHWAARTGLEHALSLRKLEDIYDRALPYLKAWSYNLTTKYGWIDEGIDNIGDMPVAVCLGLEEPMPAKHEDFSAPHVFRLVLPRHFRHFIDPNLSQDWAAMFANLMTPSTSPSSTDIFSLGRAGIPRPIQNIIYLLQLLSPGLLILRSFDEEEDGDWDHQGTDRGLPPSLWVGTHIEDLEDIFGASTALSLYHAAEDPYCSVEDISSSDSGSSAYDTLDSFSDSSSASHSEEDWASSWGDFEEDDDSIFLQFDDKHLETTHAFGMPNTNMHFNPKITICNPPIEITTIEEYRHCGPDCAYCGRCDNRFAQELTERLLLTGAAV